MKLCRSAALALAILIVPSAASADVKPDVFLANVEAHIARANTKLETFLSRSGMHEQAKDDLRRRFRVRAATVRGAARAAAADGTVTKAEARRVRDVARQPL